MNRTILITRAQEDSELVAEAIAALDYMSFIAPMLSYQPIAAAQAHINVLDPHSISAIVLTSKQALQFITLPEWCLDVPVYCIGSTTQRFAQSIGFVETYEASGNIQRLATLMGSRHATQRVLYMCGDTLAHDLEALLKPLRVELSQITTYSAVPCAIFPPDLDRALEHNMLWGVVLASQRSADTFHHLIEKHALIDTLKPLHALCWSQTIANHVAHYYTHVHALNTPTIQGLICSLEKLGEKPVTSS